MSTEGSRKSTCRQRYAGSRTNRTTRIRWAVRQTNGRRRRRRPEGWMELEGESDREGEHQGRGHEGEREQVAGRRAYGPHPYLLTSAKSITCLGV